MATRLALASVWPIIAVVAGGEGERAGRYLHAHGLDEIECEMEEGESVVVKISRARVTLR